MSTNPIWRWHWILFGGCVLLPIFFALVLARVWNVLYVGPTYSNVPPAELTAVICNDGDQILFDSSVDNSAVIKIAKITKWNSRSSVLATNAQHPHLARDGKVCFFEREAQGLIEIWKHDFSTSRQTSVYKGDRTLRIVDVDERGAMLVLSESQRHGGLGNIITYRLLDVPTNKVIETSIGAGACFVLDQGLVLSSPTGTLLLMERNGATSQLQKRGYFPTSSSCGKKIAFVRDVSVPFKEREWQVLDLTQKDSGVRYIGKCVAPAFTSDGKSLVGISTSFDGTVMEFSIDTNDIKVIARLNGMPVALHGSSAGVAAISGDGKVFALVNNTVFLSEQR